MSSRTLNYAGVISLVAQLSSAIQLPYNPTRILVASQSSNQAYIFQQTSSSQWQLASIDLSSKITASSSLTTSIIDTSLPFLSSNNDAPYSASISVNGTITVWTGDCSDLTQSEVWTFTNKAWNQISSTIPDTSIPPPQYLSRSLSFSNVTSGGVQNTKTYVFGGMCPTSDATSSDWVTSATYTNATLEFAFSGVTKPLDSNITSVSVNSPPLSQAGHSLTPLTPSYSAVAPNIMTQQQNYVLIGGHTQTAFLNLSQISIFSLPQETWSFASVLSADADLDPRSGHSAVLSSDGNSIVVFGGWVGDVTTPATPQFAVLNIADGFGGSGQWQWSTPSSSGTGLPSTSGLYGHAALMLPGNIMMITGGYSLTSTASRLKRDSTVQTANTQTYLYNVSSNSWISSYQAPSSAFATVGSPHKSGLSSPAKAGLGVGITFGLIGIFVLIFSILWYKRRQRWKRERREDDLRANQGFVSDEWGIGYEDRRRAYSQPSIPPMSHDQHNQPVQWRSPSTDKPIFTGDNRVMRKSVGGRSPYAYERSVGKRENIHTIAEKDEEDDSAKSVKITMEDEMQDADHHREGALAALSSRPNSRAMTPPEERQQEVQTWVQGWKRAGEELLGSSENGRSSPTKSDRTLSSLSTISGRSIPGSGVSSIVRSLSTTSAQILKLNPFASPAASPEPHSPTTPTAHNHWESTPKPAPTASFAQLQADSHNLLGKPPRSSPEPKVTLDIQPPRRSNSQKKNHYVANTSAGLFGSMRRAIGMGSASSGRASSLTASTNTKSYSNRRTLHDDIGTSTSTNMTGPGAMGGGLAPRRAASDAAFWRSKRGAKDWVEQQKEEEEEEGEDEWDVEGAAQNRVVQVMFTVPRERLRVVNADVDSRSVKSNGEKNDHGF
jgi:hypothetical protein